jgi:hypothetical protein
MLLNILNLFNTYAIIKNIPRSIIITGEHGKSFFHERYNPRIETTSPAVHPIYIFAIHFLAKSAEIEAGIIKNANTVRIPATLTASIIIMPKVK